MSIGQPLPARFLCAETIKPSPPLASLKMQISVGLAGGKKGSFPFLGPRGLHSPSKGEHPHSVRYAGGCAKHWPPEGMPCMRCAHGISSKTGLILSVGSGFCQVGRAGMGSGRGVQKIVVFRCGPYTASDPIPLQWQGINHFVPCVGNSVGDCCECAVPPRRR